MEENHVNTDLVPTQGNCSELCKKHNRKLYLLDGLVTGLGIFMVALMISTAILASKVTALTKQFQKFEAEKATMVDQAFDMETALEEFAMTAGLTKEQQLVMWRSANMGTISASFILGQEEHMYIDGFGFDVGENLKRDFSYGCAFDKVNGKWMAYDWSWITYPTITIPSGHYTAVIDEANGRRYDIAVHYDTLGGDNLARIDIADWYGPVTSWHSANLDYDAYHLASDHITFEYNPSDGRPFDLTIYYDGTMLLNGYTLVPDGSELTSHIA